MNAFKNKKFLQILIVNLVLLFGAIFLAWDALTLILFYVAETLIIGFTHIIKMLLLFFNNRNKPKTLNPEKKTSGLAGLFLIPFFIFHFGMFVFIQMMVFIGFTENNLVHMMVNLFSGEYKFILIILFSTHLSWLAADFLWNPNMKIYMPEDVFIEPYGRIFIQQFMVILGGMVSLISGNVLGYLVVLVILKIVFEYYFSTFNMETLKRLNEKMEKKKRLN